MTSQPVRAVATDWNALRAYCQRMAMEVNVSVGPRFLRWAHGARLAPGSSEVLEGDAPISITLAPDLVDDEPTRLVAALAGLDAAEVLIAPELAGRLPEMYRAAAWRVKETTDTPFAVVQYVRKGRHTERALSWFRDVAHAALTTTFAHVLGADPGPALAMFQALQVHHRHSTGGTAALFVTRSEPVLAGRFEDAFPDQIGQVTPEEALVLVGVLLRHRRIFLQAAWPSGETHRLDEFGWFSGAAQLFLPAYRDLYAHLTTVIENTGGQLSAERPLEYLEGLLIRLRHLLRTHDRLARLHMREAETGANNLTADAGTEQFYAAIQGAVGTLDGLAMLVAVLEGHLPANDVEWRSVTFPTLRSAQRPWVKGLKTYATAVGAAQKGWTPLLAVATSERKQGFHFFPVMGIPLQAGRVIQATAPDGSPLPRFIPDITVGVVKPVEPTVVQLTGPLGRDGVMGIQNDLYLLPWLFIRALTRDLLGLVNGVLAAINASAGVTSNTGTPLLTPAGQVLARRAFAWDEQLQIPLRWGPV